MLKFTSVPVALRRPDCWQVGTLLFRVNVSTFEASHGTGAFLESISVGADEMSFLF